MRAAFFSVVPSPYQRDLFRALAARNEIDFSVFYLERDAPDSPWPWRPLAVYERVLPGGRIFFGDARVQYNGIPSLRKYDVVILNTLMSVTAQWLMRTSAGRRPWIFWGERLKRGGRVHQFLSAPLNRASAIAAIGSWARDDYAERFPTPRHVSIPYTCDLSEFFAIPRPRPGRQGDDFVFLLCGQMIARKGVDILLRAFDRLAQARPGARLLLVGREAELPMMLSAVSKATRERVRFEGFHPPEDLPRFFAQADAFVLPSRYDGWGVVVNQALGAGLPVICSDRTGAGFDYVREEVNGARFAAGDEDALFTALERVSCDRERAEGWGRASRELAKELTPEAGAERWLNLLRTI